MEEVNTGDKCPSCGGIMPQYEVNQKLLLWWAVEIKDDRCRVGGKWLCVKCGNPAEAPR